MSKSETEKPADQGISKVKLAIGAASLFLFIIGVKRTFRMDQHQPPPEPPKRTQGKSPKRPKRDPREKR
jgi:hypothetical protein